MDWKEKTSPFFVDATYPLSTLTPILIGTLIQRFNVRNGKAAKPYRDNIAEIKEVADAYASLTN